MHRGCLVADGFGACKAHLGGGCGLAGTLTAGTIAFGKPVLLVHGDSHCFRLDKPRVNAGVSLENFTRVENIGSPNVQGVEVFVDARDPNVFSEVPRIVPGKVVTR